MLLCFGLLAGTMAMSAPAHIASNRLEKGKVVNEDTNYGGSASARAINTDTKETRWIEATTDCIHKDEATAKSSLLGSLKLYGLKFNEEFDSPVNYDISTCER